MGFKNDKIIGIVGGMGPEAGIDLFHHITELVKAKKDQGHRSIVLISFPKHITDRTSFIEGQEKVNPAYAISLIINRLEKVGASAVGIACNSSYSPEIYNVIVDQLKTNGCKVKLLHMPFETCKYIKKNFNHVRRVGIMSTNGTLKSGIYQKILKKMNLIPVSPTAEFQKEVIHEIIYDSKNGIKACAGHITEKSKNRMEEALGYFKNKKVEAVVLGCTELSLMLGKCNTRDLLLINSNKALALALIRETDVNRSKTRKLVKNEFFK